MIVLNHPTITSHVVGCGAEDAVENSRVVLHPGAAGAHDKGIYTSFSWSLLHEVGVGLYGIVVQTT